jgi:hypothetical protein
MTWVGHVDFVWAQWTKETVPRKNIETCMLTHHQKVSVFQMPVVSRGGKVYTTTWQKQST